MSEDWLSRYGNPLVALETFVDPAYFRGTSYQVSGWLALGRTKGYGRVRRDYYQKHGRPKELWFKTLHPAGVKGLRRRRLPLRYRKYEIDYRPCPFGTPAIKALFDTFEQVSDPRKRKGRRYPLKTLLTILAFPLRSTQTLYPLSFGSVAGKTVRMSDLQQGQKQCAVGFAP